MRKIFVSGLILASAWLFIGNPAAHAGVLKSCMIWLTAPPPERPIAKAYQAYGHFLKMRKENSKAVPPAFPVTKTTSKEDMFFSFVYWWLPGNIWHNLISSEYSGAQMLEEFKSEGGRVPDYTEMPEPSKKDASLNIPTLLPDAGSRTLSKKFKRQAKKDYKIYLQMRERDPRINPPTQRRHGTLLTKNFSLVFTIGGIRQTLGII